MGGVLSSLQRQWTGFVGPRWSKLLDPGRVSGQSAALLVWYLISIGFVIWAIAALAGQNVDAATPAAVGWFMPAFTSIVHLAILILSLTFIEDFALYPVEPRALFASFDALTCMLLGLTFGGLLANSLVLLILTNGLLTIPFAGVAFKYYSIVADIDSGARDENTGALVR